VIFFSEKIKRFDDIFRLLLIVSSLILSAGLGLLKEFLDAYFFSVYILSVIFVLILWAIGHTRENMREEAFLKLMAWYALIFFITFYVWEMIRQASGVVELSWNTFWFLAFLSFFLTLPAYSYLEILPKRAFLYLLLLTIFTAFMFSALYIFHAQTITQGRTAFENYYLGIMKNLNDTKTKIVLRSKFDRHYNFTDLIEWVNEQIDFVPLNETIKRHTDPFEILEYGRGRCGEFSILYVAACLAHGYHSRLIVATDVSDSRYWVDQHVWAEVKLNDGWVHVDPSEKTWNKPYMYEKWNWGKDIGSKIRIYAFEDGKYEDVTPNYKLGT